MRHLIIGKAALVMLLLAFAALAVAQTLKGPTSDKPLSEKWAPSKWGPNDRAGSANHTKNSANIARALATIKTEQGDHHRQVLPPRGAGLWPARMADDHSRDSDRGPLR